MGARLSVDLSEAILCAPIGECVRIDVHTHHFLALLQKLFFYLLGRREPLVNPGVEVADAEVVAFRACQSALKTSQDSALENQPP